MDLNCKRSANAATEYTETFYFHAAPNPNNSNTLIQISHDSDGSSDNGVGQVLLSRDSHAQLIYKYI